MLKSKNKDLGDLVRLAKEAQRAKGEAVAELKGYKPEKGARKVSRDSVEETQSTSVYSEP